MHSIVRFVAAARSVLAGAGTAEERWAEIARLVPALLGDPELRARAAGWRYPRERVHHHDEPAALRGS